MSSDKIIQKSLVEHDIYKILVAEADWRGISVDTLVDNVLRNYVNFNRYTERDYFVLFRRPLIAIILNQIPDGLVETIGKTVGSEMPKQILLSLGHDFTLMNGLWLVEEFLGKHSHWFLAKIDEQKGFLNVVLDHGINRKWSIFLVHFMVYMFKMLGLTCTALTIDDFSTSLHFKMPKYTYQLTMNVKNQNKLFMDY